MIHPQISRRATNGEEYDIRCVRGSQVIHWQGGV